MTRHFVCAGLSACIALAACDAHEPASDTPPPVPLQTAEQAAQQLCEKAGELGPGSRLGDLKFTEDDVRNLRVRNALESLTHGPPSSELFFEHMNEILGHEWECPPMRALLEVDER